MRFWDRKGQKKRERNLIKTGVYFITVYQLGPLIMISIPYLKKVLIIGGPECGVYGNSPY